MNKRQYKKFIKKNKKKKYMSKQNVRILKNLAIEIRKISKTYKFKDIIDISEE